jgi:hypothetical protein
MLGIVGLALSQRGIETDQTTRRLTQRRQILKPSSLTQGADRTVKEKKRDRWAERERELKESSTDRPKNL